MWEGIASLYSQISDAIVISIDMECVDHVSDAYDKLSEIGFSYTDMREWDQGIRPNHQQGLRVMEDRGQLEKEPARRRTSF